MKILFFLICSSAPFIPSYFPSHALYPNFYMPCLSLLLLLLLLLYHTFFFLLIFILLLPHVIWFMFLFLLFPLLFLILCFTVLFLPCSLPPTPIWYNIILALEWQLEDLPASFLPCRQKFKMTFNNFCSEFYADSTACCSWENRNFRKTACVSFHTVINNG